MYMPYKLTNKHEYVKIIHIYLVLEHVSSVEWLGKLSTIKFSFNASCWWGGGIHFYVTYKFNLLEIYSDVLVFLSCTVIFTPPPLKGKKKKCIKLGF